MLTLGSARAAFLLYQNARAVTGAADHLSRYLVPLLRDLNAVDVSLARQLELLGMRADSVTPALDFLLEWTSDKGSAVQGILFHARDTLHRIERFLAGLGSAGAISSSVSPAAGRGRGGLGGRSDAEREALSKQIDGLVKELDYALNSLSLAVAVVNASEARRPLLPAGATFATAASQTSTAACAAPAAAASWVEPPRYISPSCLLRASERMRSMGGGSGDLIVSYGSFYEQRAVDRGRSFTDAIRRAQDAPSSSHAAGSPRPRWTHPMSTVADIHTTANSAIAESDLLEEERRDAASRPMNITHSSAGGRLIMGSDNGSPIARWVEGGDVPVGSIDADGWSSISPSFQPTSYAGTAQPSPIAPLPPITGQRPPAVSVPSPDPVLPVCSNGLSAWRQVFPAACMKIVRNASRK